MEGSNMQKTTELDKACLILNKVDGRDGLGKNLYETISRLTPSVSVELIIRDLRRKMTLLTWRDDELYGPGWHVPGGVVRFKEKLICRAEKVLEKEIGVQSAKISGPVGHHEIFNSERDKRGHFISFVYNVVLHSGLKHTEKTSNDKIYAGDWRWFSVCPDNLISNQEDLRQYINADY
jgi:ADP-ribose pyrophosphatase YjhB (NUDIX family)